MVKNNDIPGDGRVIGEGACFAVEGVGEAQVEPDGGGAGEQDVLPPPGLAQGFGFVVGQPGQFGRAVCLVEMGDVDGDFHGLI